VILSAELKSKLPWRARWQLCDRRGPRRRSRPTSLAQYARCVVGLLGDLHDPQPAAALLVLENVQREYPLQQP